MVCLTNKLSCTYFVRSQVNEAESHRPNSKVVNVLLEVIVDKDKLYKFSQVVHKFLQVFLSPMARHSFLIKTYIYIYIYIYS